MRHARFLTGEWNESLQSKDLTWVGASGVEMQAQQWDDERTLCFGMLLDGRAPRSGIARAGVDASALMLFNAWHDAVEFVLPAAPGGDAWVRVLDTAAPAAAPPPVFESGATYLVTGRSMLVFAGGMPAASEEAA